RAQRARAAGRRGPAVVPRDRSTPPRAREGAGADPAGAGRVRPVAAALARRAAALSDERPAFSRYLERMQALGFRPSRSLGQNFLLDPSLHKAIARAADLRPSDVGLEIGPGIGF